MAQKQKLGIEEKVALVRRYLNGEISMSAAANEAGVVFSAMKQWVILISNQSS